MIDPGTMRNILCWVFLVLLGSPLAGNSENLVIDGLAFPIEEISPVDPHTTKVRIRGASKLIAQETVDDYVVEEWLKDKKLTDTFTAEQLHKFILSCLKGGHTRRVHAGLIALSNSKVVQGSEFDSFIEEEIGSGVDALESFKGFITSEAMRELAPERVATLLLSVASRDPAWVQTSASGILLINLEQLKREGEQKVLSLLFKKEIKAALTLIDFLSDVAGPEDPFALKYRPVERKLQDATAPGNIGEVDRFLPLVDLLDSDPALAEALHPLLVDSLHQEADRAIREKQFLKALEVLSHVQIIFRTPTTHRLVKTAIDGLSPNASPVFVGKNIEEMLKALSGFDESVKESYVSLLSKQIAYQLGRDDLGAAQALFMRLLDANPDPSRINDRLRILVARAYLSVGEPGNARREVENVKTGLALRDYIKLFFSGYYINLGWLFIAIFSPLAAAVIFFGLPRFRILRDISDVRSQQKSGTGRGSGEFVSEEELGPEAPEKLFVNPKVRVEISPQEIEYNRALRQLGLSSNSTLSQIKNAYRRAVKKAHPDAHKDSDAMASERFIELTHAYERILELRKQLGLPDV